MNCPAVCLAMKPVGEPYAVVPHVRFDEKGWETEPGYAGMRSRTERFSNNPPDTYRHRAQSLLYHLLNKACGGNGAVSRLPERFPTERAAFRHIARTTRRRVNAQV